MQERTFPLLRHSIPPVPSPLNRVPDAQERHKQGFSCQTVCAYAFDANGFKRWCIDCEAPLGEASWAEGGHEMPTWASALVLVLAGLLLLVVVSLVYLSGRGANLDGTAGIAPGVRATPATYGPPRAKPNGVVGGRDGVVP